MIRDFITALSKVAVDTVSRTASAIFKPAANINVAWVERSIFTCVQRLNPIPSFFRVHPEKPPREVKQIAGTWLGKCHYPRVWLI